MTDPEPIPPRGPLLETLFGECVDAISDGDEQRFERLMNEYTNGLLDQMEARHSNAGTGELDSSTQPAAEEVVPEFLVARLEEIMRQTDPWRRRALRELCRGHPQFTEAVRAWVLRTVPDRPDLIADLVDVAKTGTKGPNQIGPYKIVRRIARGGMGTVYLAQQVEKFRRMVALKVIRTGMDSREVLARFKAEQRALAMMNHTHIARMYDAGTTSWGRPYFVMEYVMGVPINEYCDKHRLTTAERLDLFISVCRGVNHAHENGIVHRDLKPSNILVTRLDDLPIPKVIDFGVAKAINQRMAERTMFTQTGLIVGTPEYMSPEQAEQSETGIDARTDVYSLGMLLYEVMVGALPFDAKALRKQGLFEIRRTICELEPPRPSTRFSNIDDAESAKSIAEKRRTTERMLVRDLRGPLDWIIMRAIEKDPARRYPTANAFADDIGRMLRSELVEARAPSFSYRTQAFAQRHTTALRTAGLAIGIVLLAALALWIQGAGYENDLDSVRNELRDAKRIGDEHRREAERFAARLARLEANRATDGTTAGPTHATFQKSGSTLWSHALGVIGELANADAKRLAAVMRDVGSRPWAKLQPALAWRAAARTLDDARDLASRRASYRSTLDRLRGELMTATDTSWTTTDSQVQSVHDRVAWLITALDGFDDALTTRLQQDVDRLREQDK